MRTPLIRGVFLLAITLAVASCTEVIPPCTPVDGATVDPCEAGDHYYEWTHFHADYAYPQELPRMREYLDSFEASRAAHIVVRGTYLPGTIRCTLGTIREAPLFGEVSFEGRAITKCYVDVRVNEYLVGTGPTTLTVEYLHDLWENDEHTRSDLERTLAEGGEGKIIEVPRNGIAGREWIIFLRPPFDVSTEAWKVGSSWDVQQGADDRIVAIRPGSYELYGYWLQSDISGYLNHKAEIEKPLHALVSEVKVAHRERVREYRGRIGADKSLPTLVHDASKLSDYFKAVGAYDHPAGSPTQPPPVRMR